VRLSWATDIHLDFVSEAGLEAFARALGDSDTDAAVLTGDLSAGPHVTRHLEALSAVYRRPIYFVLGNHEYYGNSIDEVRARVVALGERCPELRWLSGSGAVSLGTGTALVGHDGWADGRCGGWATSKVMLNDYFLIHDLSGLTADRRLARMQALAEEAVVHLREVVPRALERHETVVVATHVPPFREACWHEGAISSDDWLPHFTCKTVGDTLVSIMRSRPDRKMLVLCGHTHSSGVTHPLPNLEVRTGGADYGAPMVQTVLDL